MMLLPAVCLLLQLQVPIAPTGPSAGATPLDADEAVRRALENAPALEAQRADVLREQERARRIEIDPLRFNFDHRAAEQVFGPRFDGNGDPYGPLDRTYAELGLRPPSLSQFGVDQTVDGRRAASLERDLEASRRAIAAETRLLHAHALLRRDETRLVADAIQIGTRMRDAVAAQVAAEAATLLDASAAELELLDLQLDLDDIQAQQARAVARLGRLTRTAGQVELTGETPACTPPPPAAMLLPIALLRSPRLQALQMRGAALDAEAVAAVLRFVPWVRQLSIGYLNEPIDKRDQIRAGVQLEVPVFAFFDGEGRDLELRRARNAAEVREAEAEIAEDVIGAVDRLRAAAELVQKHREATDAVTRRSTDAVDAALASNSADTVAASAVYARALKSQRAHLRARERCVEATIELMRLTGDVLAEPVRTTNR